MAPPKRNRKSRTHATAKLLKLLRRRPLPLRALVKTILSDPHLLVLVQSAAAAEGAIALDVESAVVLLGAEGLRRAVAKQKSQPNGEIGGCERSQLRPARANAGRLRALRQAIASDRYRVNPCDVATAMLRELERTPLK
jgi:hypothetical protein